MGAGAAGIGGGGLVMPILTILFGFRVHVAVPLSNVNILLSGITRFVMNFN